MVLAVLAQKQLTFRFRKNILSSQKWCKFVLNVAENTQHKKMKICWIEEEEYAKYGFTRSSMVQNMIQSPPLLVNNVNGSFNDLLFEAGCHGKRDFIGA